MTGVDGVSEADAAVSLSRALALTAEGLRGWGDSISWSLLEDEITEATSSVKSSSRPDRESTEAGRPNVEREESRGVAAAARGAPKFRAPPEGVSLGLVEGTDECLAALAAVEVAGGAMDARCPATDKRLLGPGGGAREEAEGVAVREATVLGGPLKVLVGDLAGDRVRP